MTATCVGCKEPVGADDLYQGVCPRCLIAVALADDEDATDVSTLTDPAEAIGETLGPYEIVNVLGEGGMGVVYLARQTAPIRRSVALKLIKLGMDTHEVVARFETERQTLALMDHPNIAKVYEAGVTPRGRPYFVMEHVPGMPVTRYCDEHRLPLPDRLRLFVEFCRGIQHAHHKGVIHRDVKPTNLLVTEVDGRPAAKVIDFGVAKAIDADGAGRTLFTRRGTLIGTPEYMAPEQTEGGGRNVDTRTDVYALGLTLYELLVGTPPLDPQQLRSMSLDEARECIRAKEFPRPSSRILDSSAWREAARRRSTDPATLRRELRGDLDWVVMTALAKDPALRYASPSELAADVGRHLAHEPVSAGPPGPGYRLRKFVRRHRIAVGVAALVLTLLVTLAATMTVLAGRIAKERDRANREADAAGRVSAFLVDLFEVSDPGASQGEAVSAREILDRGAKKIDRELKAQPEVQARLMATMGTVYKKMGLYDDAMPLLERSQRIRAEVLGENHPDTLRSMLETAELCFYRGRADEAESLLREARRRALASLGPDDPIAIAALSDLAVAMHFSGNVDEAEGLYREALEARQGVLGRDHPDTLETTNNIAALHVAKGDLAAAEPYARAALEGRERALGAAHPETLDSLINLGVILQALGRLEEAETYSRRAVELGRRIRPDHPKTLVSVNNLAKVLELQGKLAEAEAFYSEALERFRAAVGEDHADTITAKGNLGDLYTRLGRLDEAGRLLESAVASARRALPAPNLVAGYTLGKYGRYLAKAGRHEQAEAVLVEARDLLVAAAGAGHARTLAVEGQLAELREARERAP